MAFEDILRTHFGKVLTEVDFVKKTYKALEKFGFSDDNTIAAVCVCRDEISQSLRSIIKHIWGEAFNLSSLGGMFFAGKTALKAAMHHAPKGDGKERYVYYAMSHIAIDEGGRMGFCSRKGIKESQACGALCGFLGELQEKKVNVSIDDEDAEQSHLKMRLLKEIPYGHVPDLLELTRIAQKVIFADLEKAIHATVDIKKSDYALITGIQVHGPEKNYVWPAKCYAVIDELTYELTQYF
jgi:Limiting CO2-inducible proteins B/C beta carbonyic anhydrases